MNPKSASLCLCTSSIIIFFPSMGGEFRPCSCLCQIKSMRNDKFSRFASLSSAARSAGCVRHNCQCQAARPAPAPGTRQSDLDRSPTGGAISALQEPNVLASGEIDIVHSPLAKGYSLCNISPNKSCSGHAATDFAAFQSSGSISEKPSPLLLNRTTQLTPFDQRAINV